MVWDTLSSDEISVTDAERALLDARLADMERNPMINLPSLKLKPASKRHLHVFSGSNKNMRQRPIFGVRRLDAAFILLKSKRGQVSALQKLCRAIGAR
jgi:hypothetical protein